ncbi:MAG: hypothetical protein RQ760_16925 [Sedimentisphaerales bacterium]|nr:hypothetical protein [Sedimentisphaerales bacterium]
MFQFLLLDAGPIIKLFSLGIWDVFIEHCEVGMSRIIAEDEVLYTEDDRERIDLNPYKERDLIKIIDVEPSVVKTFYDKFDLLYQADIHDGEKETLAFLFNSSDNWLVCSADHVVFKMLGRLNKTNQGISLEEILKTIGIGQVSNWKNITPKDKDWKYTKKFKEKWTQKGQIDFIQDQGV